MSFLPLTYPDLICDLDVDPFAAETTSDLQNLIQDLTHVLLEKLGSNPDDPNRGVGIEDYLSGTNDVFRSLPGKIEEQFLSDDRVTSCIATINNVGDGPFGILITVGVSGNVIPLQFGWQSGTFQQLTGR